MNTIWRTAIHTGILFIALISKTWGKEIDTVAFAKSFVDIRGKELILDKTKPQAFILIIAPYCSKCVHQIISELKYKKDSVEIVFLSYKVLLDDKYSQRKDIDFLHDNYSSTAKVYFYDKNVELNKILNIDINNLNTPELFIHTGGELYYLSHLEMFPKGIFNYKSIRKYFKSVD